MKPQAPIVGTGIEKKVAVDSRSAITRLSDGKVVYVDSEVCRISSGVM